MDPNETLNQLRELLDGDHSNLIGLDSDEVRQRVITPWTTGPLATLCRCEELFQALDEWLSCGGSLPTRWVSDR